MKTTTLLILVTLLLSTGRLASQQLELSWGGHLSSYAPFNDGMGYSVSWHQPIHPGSEVALSFVHAWRDTPYDWIYSTQWIIERTYIEKRDPFNQRFGARLSVSTRLVDYPKASVSAGTLVSVNWLGINEKTHRFANEDFEDSHYYTKRWQNGKPGTGVFLETEIRELFTPRLSLAMRLTAESIIWKLFSWSLTQPNLVNFLTADVSVRWRFGGGG